MKQQAADCTAMDPADPDMHVHMVLLKQRLLGMVHDVELADMT